MKRAGVLVSAVALAGSAFAQAGASEQRACEQARGASASGDAVMQATYANCLVMGIVHERHALAHARELARKSMKQGSEIGAFALYAAYANDPAYAFMKDGKPDMDRYKALGSRPVESRAEQVEALEALAFAASKAYPKALQALSVYYHETVAPKNVARLRALAATMSKDGVRAPWLDRFEKDAVHVAAAGATKASVHVFLDAEKPATLAASAMLSKDGEHCRRVKLAGVESGDLQGPVFLPLQSPALRDSYLVKGSWDESWRFEGCGREARVPVHFSADGWGGATFSLPAVHVRS